MRVDHLIHAAVLDVLQGDFELQTKWVSITHKLSAKYALASATRVPGDTRVDLLLRKLEAEAIVRLNAPGKVELVWATDIQLSLSEYWVMSSYEVIRSVCQQARKQGDVPQNLIRLRDRLGLVRMPIAKYEIASANKKKSELMLEAANGNPDSKQYRDDGSYVVPRGIDAETGSVIWWPVDLTSGTSIGISRRMLSDEFLAIFD